MAPRRAGAFSRFSEGEERVVNNVVEFNIHAKANLNWMNTKFNLRQNYNKNILKNSKANLLLSELYLR